jgi:hypothetical protein
MELVQNKRPKKIIVLKRSLPTIIPDKIKKVKILHIKKEICFKYKYAECYRNNCHYKH